MVTTPQDVALLDVRKGLEMFRKVDVNVLGVIENMSTHICSNAGMRSRCLVKVGDNVWLICAVPLLGQLPLSLAIRDRTSIVVCPTVVADPESSVWHYAISRDCLTY